MKNLFVTATILPFAIKQAWTMSWTSRILGYVAVTSADHFKIGLSFFDGLRIASKRIRTRGLGSDWGRSKHKGSENNESLAPKEPPEFTHREIFSYFL
jgi:hypothetical protein